MDRKKIKNVFYWLWVLTFIYSLFLGIIMLGDVKAHPEWFALVEKRPEANIGDKDLNFSTPIILSDVNNPQRITPAWMFKANTFDECKPLIYISNFFNKWVAPLIYVVFILAGLNILLAVDWGGIIKGLRKVDNKMREMGIAGEDDKKDKGGDDVGDKTS